MINIKGKYNSAKVFTDNLEQKAREQIVEVCNAEYLQKCKIRIMPDVHAGAGCTIGTTMTINDCVVPNMVGVDIGCGMETVAIKERTLDYEKLDKLIRKTIPFGRDVRNSENCHEYSRQIDLSALHCVKSVKLKRAVRSIGTLGGGNHFIEIDTDDEGGLYLVVHSGSRHLGTEVAEYYQSEGFYALSNSSKYDLAELIENLETNHCRTDVDNAVKERK